VVGAPSSSSSGVVTWQSRVVVVGAPSLSSSGGGTLVVIEWCGDVAKLVVVATKDPNDGLPSFGSRAQHASRVEPRVRGLEAAVTWLVQWCGGTVVMWQGPETRVHVVEVGYCRRVVG
jgi:hypothetical protein